MKQKQLEDLKLGSPDGNQEVVDLPTPPKLNIKELQEAAEPEEMVDIHFCSCGDPDCQHKNANRGNHARVPASKVDEFINDLRRRYRNNQGGTTIAKSENRCGCWS